VIPADDLWNALSSARSKGEKSYVLLVPVLVFIIYRVVDEDWLKAGYGSSISALYGSGYGSGSTTELSKTKFLKI
jgi:hypothetical protein